MNNFVRIFNSIEEQEQYHKQIMLQSTVTERFRKLYQMQQITKLSMKGFENIFASTHPNKHFNQPYSGCFILVNQ